MVESMPNPYTQPCFFLHVYADVTIQSYALNGCTMYLSAAGRGARKMPNFFTVGHQAIVNFLSKIVTSSRY